MPKSFRASARRAVEVVEAAYSLEGTDTEWLGRVLDAARADFDSGCGMSGFTCRVDASRLEIGPTYVERDLDPSWAERSVEFNRTVPDAFFSLVSTRSVMCGAFLETLRRMPVLTSHLEAAAAGTAIADAVTIFAQDGEGHGVSIAGPSAKAAHVHPRVVGIWRRLGVHLATALRLRRHVAALDAPREALLTTSGAIADAQGVVRSDRHARALLSRAVGAVERARTDRERHEPDRALELWRGLVGGEWSPVDHWEADGRRYMAAYRNRPRVADPRALTPQERLVLRFATLGESNKEIAFTLGLSVTAVASAMGQILRKLACRRRSDLLAWGALARARHATVPLRAGELGVVSVAHSIESALSFALPAAERDIADRVVRGETDAQIARARGTSARTVANQLRRLFDRVGVGTRAELVVALTRSAGT